MNTAIEAMTDNEKRMFELYVDAYALGGYSRNVNADYLLREWNTMKSEYLFPMLGNNLILSKSISIQKEEEVLITDMRTMLRTPIGSHFLDSFYEKVINPFSNNYNTGYYAPDENDPRAIQWRLAGNLEHMIRADALVTNTYHGETFDLYLPDWEKPIKINNGAKITRLLGKIAKAVKIDDLYEEFRIAHSQVLNQKELHGELCLSIHPLDFATMSDNESGWSSCMSWQNDGCYRQGTIEMMNSHCVVMAYLKADENMPMPGFGNQWNNKKWRELFIVTPQMISDVKGYPYCSETLSKITVSWLKELATAAGIGGYGRIEQYIPWDNEPLDDGNVVDIDPITSYMYNDFTNERTNFGCFNYDKMTQDENGKYKYSICYSGTSECLACGHLNVEVSSEGMLIGDCCEVIYTCEECDCTVDDEDELTEVDGELLCQDCLENRCEYDALTDEIHLSRNMKLIHFYNEDKGIARYDTISILWDDFEDRELMSRYFKRLYRYAGVDGEFIYVKDEDCTDDGRKLFDCGYYDTYIEVDKNVKYTEAENATTFYYYLGVGATFGYTINYEK